MSVKGDGEKREWSASVPVGSKALEMHGKNASIPFKVESVEKLRLEEGHVLLDDGAALDEAVEASQGNIWKKVQHITVFKRMKATWEKARVIRALQKRAQRARAHVSTVATTLC